MRMNRMKLRQLEYFNALCASNSFSRVAKQFGVSQPTVSQAIKSLENSLQITLITRDQSHSTIRLTEAGKLFRVYSENAIQQLSMGKSALKTLTSNRISFGLSATLSRFFNLSQHISTIENVLKNEISLVEDGSKDIMQKIASNNLDIALFASNKKVSSDHLDLVKIAAIPFKLAVSNKHPLSKQSQIQLIEVEKEEFVLFNEHFIHHDVFWKYVHDSKIIPNILAEVSDITSFKNFIIEKNAIGILIDLWKFNDISLIELNETPEYCFNLYLGKQKYGKVSDEMFKAVETYILKQLKIMRGPYKNNHKS